MNNPTLFTDAAGAYTLRDLVQTARRRAQSQTRDKAEQDRRTEMYVQMYLRGLNERKGH